MTAASIIFALVIDKLLGEPKHYHPLVGFGSITKKIEAFFLQNTEQADSRKKCNGVIACLLLTLPLPCLLWAFLWLIKDYLLLTYFINISVLYLVIGGRSLEQHANNVLNALQADNIGLARQHVSYMVSRETAELDEESICKATIESVLENGSDAIFAPIFWFIILGAPGALYYRLVNTLDAMWGYKNNRYLQFGWAAARLDDIVNWIPARLTALSYALVGNYKNALAAWQQQGKLWDSPNAGVVMASGAGALSLKLGGPQHYHGQLKDRPVLGVADAAASTTTDIKRATSLLERTTLLWLLVIFMIAYLS